MPPFFLRASTTAQECYLMSRSIADCLPTFNKNLSNSTNESVVTTPNLSLLSITAKRKSKRPLSKLQWMLLLTIKQDCRIQEYSNRSIEELAILTGHSERGVQAALKVLNDNQYIFSKKQTRGYNTVRCISNDGLSHITRRFKLKNKSASQSASQKPSIPYRVSSSSKEHDNADLLARDSIIKTCRREEECFRALNFNELDELVIITALRRSHLSRDERFKIATTILASHYKRVIQHKRAYYLATIENFRG